MEKVVLLRIRHMHLGFPMSCYEQISTFVRVVHEHGFRITYDDVKAEIEDSIEISIVPLKQPEVVEATKKIRALEQEIDLLKK